MRENLTRLVSILALLVLAGPVLAEPFNPATGRDVRQFPPDPQVDFQHITLDLRMPEPMTKSFDCTETITFRTAGRPIGRLDLNAVNLDVHRVSDLSGQPLDFRNDDQKLTVRFGKELPANTDAGAVIEYTCTKPKTGMIFALPDEAHPTRPLMIHTQGEDEDNRYWFACHDYPNAKQTTETIVTVPSKLKVLSNGGLVEKADVGNGLTRWHYKLNHPQVSYLVSIVIGEFEVVTDKWRDVPVEYWVEKDKVPTVRRTFGRTPEMIELFSKLTGVDYPYEKYAQAVVYDFAAGGMENTSCTTLIESTGLDERAALDHDEEGLISHELAHQWFGDMITCKSWAHIWLNEGFATFMDAIWHEHAHGREEYDYTLWRTMNGVAATDTVESKAPLVYSGFGSEGMSAFHRGADPYGKGASVLHMLRRSLGDELFWRCIQEYAKRYAWKTAESDDLRKVIDELSGRSYERFFTQWVYRSGVPHMKVTYAWDDAAHEAKLSFEQTQRIAEDSPAFDVKVPVWLCDAGGKRVGKETAHVEDRFGHVTIACEKEPAQAVIDPEGAVLMQADVELPLKMVIAQANKGPTPRSRYDAIARLATQDRDSARDALRSILTDESQHYSFRTEAANALGKQDRPEARDILILALGSSNGGIKDHKTRRAAVDALDEYHGHDVAELLVKFAKSDPTYTVEAVATEGLAKQDETDEIGEVLLANTRKNSYRDQIRIAAVNALAELGDVRGIGPAKELAGPASGYRSRSRGIEALGKLAQDQDSKVKEDVRRFLVGLLNDPSDRAAGAACRALGDLGDDKAIPDLQRLADGAAKERLQSAAESAIGAIRKKSAEPAQLKALQDRIDRLEKARERDLKRGPTTGKSEK